MRKHLVTWIKNVPSTLETCYGECLEMVGFFCHPLSFIYFLYKSGNTKTTKLNRKQNNLYAALALPPVWGWLLTSAESRCYSWTLRNVPKLTVIQMSQTWFMVKALYFNCFVTKYISCTVLIKGHWRSYQINFKIHLEWHLSK